MTIFQCLQQHSATAMKMDTREEDVAIVTLTTTKLKTPTMDWSVKDQHKEFIVFQTLVKMWLQTKGVPDHKQ